MPVVPTFVERLVLLRLNRGPGAILDLFGAGSVEAATLAIDLGVFEALAEEPLPARELAERVDADPDGLGTLLDILAATGYVATTEAATRIRR